MPVVEGDAIVAYGNWKSDGTFAVKTLYANIWNVKGTVSAVDEEKGTRQRPFVVHKKGLAARAIDRHRRAGPILRKSP